MVPPSQPAQLAAKRWTRLRTFRRHCRSGTRGLSERSEQEPKCEIILGAVYLAGRSRLAGEPQATVTALSSPTSGSEGNLRTHRECVELGAGIPGVGRADLLGNVAVQVIKHETNVAVDVPVQTRGVDCLPPTRDAICSP